MKPSQRRCFALNFVEQEMVMERQEVLGSGERWGSGSFDFYQRDET